MALLVLQLPPRERAGAPTHATPEYAWVSTSADGELIHQSGRAAASLLPRAESAVLVLSPADVSWHRITLPKAPAARLRAALAGLLEEQLLEDDEALHLALAPGATAGQPTWVAAMHKPWLQEHLNALEKAGVIVDRVVPACWPGDAPMGHFFALDEAADGSSANTWLAHSDADGAQCLNLAGGLARALAPQWTSQATRWSATPAVAAQAERWLGAPVMALTDAEHALQAVRSLWNLRQFDLAARHRGTRAARDLLKRLASPAWRPVRLGAAALVVLQIAGLNLWAWQQERALTERKQAMVDLLKNTHPQVRAVLDAPLQMQRETDQLRAAAGRAGEGDLEALLAAAASAWPPGQGPAESLRFEPGRLSVGATGWSPQQIEDFRQRLRPAGWAVDSVEGRLQISRAAPPRPAAS